MSRPLEKAEGCRKAVMGQWKKNWRVTADGKRVKGGSRSNTPGKTKGDNCVCTPLDRYFARRGRSYKDKDYSAWFKRKTGE